MTKHNRAAEKPDDTRVTMSVNGGEEVDMTGVLKALDGVGELPELLRDYRLDIAKALVQPMPGMWVKGTTYMDAPDAAAIGAVLIEAIHTHLEGWRIAYVFREKMAHHDKITLAKASKAGSKIEYFTGFDALIEVNWQTWRALTKTQRLALIDHELKHFGREEDEDTGDENLVMLGHDIEEFRDIVSRWGFWMPDVAAFAKTIRDQRDLFEKNPLDS
jgi:hypothetical protein